MNNFKRYTIAWLSALLVLFAQGLTTARAELFPTRPIKIILPVDPGGSLDIIIRSIGSVMSDELGQPVVIENRPGASQGIGVQALMRAAADGYTLLAISNTTLTAPSLSKSAQWDPPRDFTGVGLVALVPGVLVVPPNSANTSAQKLTETLQKQPAALNGGTAGTGSFAHITTELFFQQAGVKTTLIPYKGSAAALVDMMGGRIDFYVSVVPESVELITAGKLKAIAVTSPQRSPLYPTVPTLAEAGLAGFTAEVFNGIVAPKGTPTEVISRLNAALIKATSAPDLQAKYSAQGVRLQRDTTPELFNEFIRNETQRYKKLIADSGISE